MYRRLYIKQRMRGIGIIDIKDKGILVVVGKNKKFIFPGGGANKREGRRNEDFRIKDNYKNIKLSLKLWLLIWTLFEIKYFIL